MSMSAHEEAKQFVDASLRLVQVAVGVLLTYWTLHALLVPVTVFDAQTYNLARVALAQAGGLFGNEAWNAHRQVIFPWSFDAAHYPFLAWFRGWGVALPSFLCFLGVLATVHLSVAKAWGPKPAWWCTLTVFALPTLMFQATSTKNDLAIVLGVACWFYAWQWWREKGGRAPLWWMAIALGFGAGAKSTGVILAVVLGLYSLWTVRRSTRLLAEQALALALAALLLGSVETYINNRFVYGSWLGPKELVDEHRNLDGLRGTCANVVRYVIANQSAVIDVAHPKTPVSAALHDFAGHVLSLTGLKNVGYRHDFNDEVSPFHKDGWESATDFGAVGGLAILAAGFFLFSRPWTTAIFRLSLAAWLTLFLTAATVAWMPWNARFLLLPFLLCSCALTLRLLERQSQRWILSGWLALLLFTAFVPPFFSLNKGPESLWASIFKRRTMTMREHASVREMVDAVEAIGRDASPTAKPGRPVVWIVAGMNSWILPFLQLRGVQCVSVPKPTAEKLRAHAAAHPPGHVLYLDLPPRELAPQLLLQRTFLQPDCALYQAKPN